MYQHPLIPLILSSILTLLVIKQCLTRRRFYRGKLVMSFLLNLSCALFLVFYDEIASNENSLIIVQWILVGLDIIIGILIVLFNEYSSSKEQFNQDLFATLDKSKLYVLVDRKNRIKEISSLFLSELEVEDANRVYKKNLFDVIEWKYRIVALNDNAANKNDLKIYFNDPEMKIEQLSLELQDDKGDVCAYYFDQRQIEVFGKYRGRIFVGDKKTSENLVGMEKDLAESIDELDIIKNRFITILEKSKEGIFFTDLNNKSIWINDVLLKELCLNQNDLSLEEYISNIHPEDLAIYKSKMAQINNIHPNYSISYRFNTGTKYIYVKEEGKRISRGNQIELCGILKPIDSSKYLKSDVDIDGVLSESEMLSCMNRLYSQDRMFLAVMIKMTSIPKINEQYGRNIGNMALSEYLKLINQRFIDNNYLYRLSGLEFMAIITDYRKMEQLKNGLHNGEKVLHVQAEYGSMIVKVDVNMGIIYSTEAKDSKDVIKKVKEALKIASNEQFRTNFAYYKDIK